MIEKFIDYNNIVLLFIMKCLVYLDCTVLVKTKWKLFLFVSNCK